MERILTWKISKEQEGMSVEKFLRTRGCSHHVLSWLKRPACGIFLNGARTYTNRLLCGGDELQICIVETEASGNILPVDIPVPIVYEDEDLLVVNKPSDMPIHPSVNNHENTLANSIMYHFTSRGIPFVYRCINRLDRDTSGLLIIAKNMFSGAVLADMASHRKIERDYLAVVEGCLPASGSIDAPIARMEGSALMRCVDQERGEAAVTHFRRLAYVPPAPEESFPRTSQADCAKTSGRSLALVHLETGRTHQIRVHMKYIGHPLLGDFLYNPGADGLIRGQALHSHRLCFHHPVTGKRMEFICELPPDMARLV